MTNTNGWERIAMNNLKNAYNWIVGGQENARDDGDITEEQFQNWIEKEALEQIYAEAITTLYTGDSEGGKAPKEMRFAGKNFCYKYLKRLFEEDGYNVTLETNKKEIKTMKNLKTTKVVLKAFTGMLIGEYEAKVTKTGYTITTKKGDMEFNKDGTQKINCRNAKFNSHIELLA